MPDGRQESVGVFQFADGKQPNTKFPPKGNTPNPNLLHHVTEYNFLSLSYQLFPFFSYINIIRTMK